jgi:hypothetical protein
MLTPKPNHSDASTLPLLNAVFCLDCEMISESRTDECPACKGRSLVNLSRMLGGSLSAHRAKQFGEHTAGLFDITMTIELQQMHSKDVTTALERITNVIGPELARDQATFRVKVKPTGEGLSRQGSLSFLAKDAA